MLYPFILPLWIVSTHAVISFHLNGEWVFNKLFLLFYLIFGAPNEGQALVSLAVIIDNGLKVLAYGLSYITTFPGSDVPNRGS